MREAAQGLAAAADRLGKISQMNTQITAPCPKACARDEHEQAAQHEHAGEPENGPP